MASPKTILYFVLALALVRGVMYASIFPPWQAPDEPSHFERSKAAFNTNEYLNSDTSTNQPAWYAEVTRSLFVFDFWDYLDSGRPSYNPDEPLTRYIHLYGEKHGTLYGSRPAYALTALPLFFTSYPDITLQLFLIRLNMVLMNVGIILFAYLITKTIFPQNPFLYLGVPILVLFNPQHTHLLAAVNSGNLAELLVTATFYFMVRGIVKGFSWFNMFMIAGLTLAAMWTKATAYFLPLVIGTIFISYLWQYRRYWYWLLPLGLVGLLSGYYFMPARVSLLILKEWDQIRAGDGLYLNPIVPKDMFRSFWAMPGWTIFQLHPMWYQILVAGCLLAIAGLLILVFQQQKLFFTKEYQPKIQALVVLAIAIMVAIGIVLGWSAIESTLSRRQGRNIYPLMVPISLFLMLGWQQFIPKEWRKMGLLAITLAFFLFDTMVLFQYTIPFFYSRY